MYNSPTLLDFFGVATPTFFRVSQACSNYKNVHLCGFSMFAAQTPPAASGLLAGA